MSIWGDIRTGLRIVGAAVAVATGQFQIAAALLSYEASSQAARSARNKARSKYNESLKDRFQMIKSATAVRSIIYGRARVSGPILFAHSSGDKQQFLHLVVALSGHESDGIESVYLNDTVLPAEGTDGFVRSGDFFAGRSDSRSASTPSGSVWPPTSAKTIALALGANETLGRIVSVGVLYNVRSGSRAQAVNYTVSGNTITIPTGQTALAESGGSGGAQPTTIVCTYEAATGTPLVRVRKWLGGTVGQPFPELVTESGGKWSAGSHLLRGITALYVRLEFNQDVFGQTGLPNISAVVRGRRVLDTRTGLSVWTDNAALCLRDYLATYRDATAAQLPAAEISAAADVCDQAVTVTTTPLITSETRYTCNGVLGTDATPGVHLDMLTEAMAGGCVWTQGRWLIRAGAHRAATLTITESMLGDAPPVIRPFAPRTELINRVTARYSEPSKGYTEVEAPPVASSTALAADGLDLPLDVQYELVQGSIRVQRLARIELLQRRNALTVQLSCSLKAYDLSPSDTVALTLGRYGWSGKLFTVLSRSLDPQTMQVGLVLQETASAIWDWVPGDATVVDFTANTTLPSPFAVPSVLTGLSASSSGQQAADGSVINRINLTWAASSSAYVSDGGGTVEIDYRRLDASGATLDWSTAAPVAGSSTSATLAPVVNGALYEVRVRPRSSVGKAGAWAYVLHTVEGTDVAGQFSAVQVWDFTGSANGFEATSQVTFTPDTNALIVAATGNDPYFASPVIALDGARYDKVRARIKRLSGTGWQGALYYQTAGHGWSEFAAKYIADATTAASGYVVLEWDMAALTAGGADWTSNAITRLRFDLGTTAADQFAIDWIAVGRYGPANYVFDTSQLVDGAGLGTTAAWSGVGGRPADAQIYNSELVPSIQSAAIGDNLFVGNLANITGSLSGGVIASTGFADPRGGSTGVVVRLPVAPSYVYYHVFDQAGRAPGWYNVSLKLYVVAGMGIVVSATDGSSWNASEYKIASTTSTAPVWVTCVVRVYVGANGAGLDVVIGSYHKGTPVSSSPSFTEVAVADLYVYADRYEGDINATNGATFGVNISGQAQTGDIAVSAISDTFQVDDAGPFTPTNISAGTINDTVTNFTVLASINYTATADCTLVATASAVFSWVYLTSSTGSGVHFDYLRSSATPSVLGRFRVQTVLTPETPGGQGKGISKETHSQKFALLAGQSTSIEFRTNKLSDPDRALSVTDASLKVQVLKR